MGFSSLAPESDRSLAAPDAFPWFALQVEANREKHVASLLCNKGYTAFLPLYRARRRWSDRFKDVQLALFPGYLFCRFDPLHRLPVLTTPGVRYVVGLGKIPVPVREAEIDAVRRIVGSELSSLPWPFVQVGDFVRLEEGPLAGLEGILIQFKGRHRLVVSVTLLQRSVAVEIDRAWVRRLGPRCSPSAAS